MANVTTEAILANLKYAFAITQGEIVGRGDTTNIVLASLNAAMHQSGSLSQVQRIKKIFDAIGGSTPYTLEELQISLTDEIRSIEEQL